MFTTFGFSNHSKAAVSSRAHDVDIFIISLFSAPVPEKQIHKSRAKEVRPEMKCSFIFQLGTEIVRNSSWVVAVIFKGYKKAKPALYGKVISSTRSTELLK